MTQLCELSFVNNTGPGCLDMKALAIVNLSVTKPGMPWDLVCELHIKKHNEAAEKIKINTRNILIIPCIFSRP